MLPPGFEILQVVQGVGDDDSDEAVYYRLERDGSATIGGRRTKKIISKTLSDGSKISGGVSAQGMLFGERIIRMPDGEIRRHPLRWADQNVQPIPTRSIEPANSAPVAFSLDSFISPSERESIAPRAPVPTSVPVVEAMVSGPDENLEALREAAILLEAYETRLAVSEASNAALKAEIALLRATTPAAPALPPLMPGKV
jgi:hypothetical protein